MAVSVKEKILSRLSGIRVGREFTYDELGVPVDKAAVQKTLNESDH